MMRKLIRRSLIALPWVLLAVIIAYFAFWGGLKDATTGRFHRIANELFFETGSVTRAEITLLMGTEPELREETFPIRPYSKDHPTIGSVNLEGEELDQFLEIWKYQRISYWEGAMCHLPVYGFRLYRDKKLVGETSICWGCSNFYITPYPGVSGWYGFEAGSPEGKALLEFCDAKMPYDRTQSPGSTTEAEPGR